MTGAAPDQQPTGPRHRRGPGAGPSDRSLARDWQAFHGEVAARVPQLAEDLLGKPSMQTRQEWRWGRRGSLSVVIAGAKAGQWYDHERGEGGGFRDLVARELCTDRDGATEWLDSRIGTLPSVRPARRKAARQQPALAVPTTSDDQKAARAARGRNAAAATWNLATPARPDHPYLVRKQVSPHGLRESSAGELVVPLRDLAGTLHSIEFIAEDGAKRYLFEGAKSGHFCTIGGPLLADRPILVCEGWATGASLHEATGHVVLAAMDAGNMPPVAEILRAKFPDADIVLVADNDSKPEQKRNTGIIAATKAARAIGGRLAVPPIAGDANDLAEHHGLAAVAAMVAAAERLPEPAPTYAAPLLTPDEARAELASALRRFMADIPVYWRAVEDMQAAPTEPAEPLDFNRPIAVVPPLLGLPVDVGLGKTSSTRQAVADLLGWGVLGSRKVIFAVPRHDLGAEQVAAFDALGIRAMLWKGRGAPDPSRENPDRLMCLDQDATFDAIEVERPVEQSCCKLTREGETHTCPHYETCGYQRQKAAAKAAQVIVCAHDSLFHIKPEVIGDVGLLVIDEGFWQAGLRGLDGKAVLTLDGLDPGSVTCWKKGKPDVEATADLTAARQRLRKALEVIASGPPPVALLQAVGLTPEDCRNAATLERRRWRDPGLLPGMDGVQRRNRIARVLPPPGEPWAPPGRAAQMWLILAQALENDHDAAGAEVGHELTENGSVRSLTLRWRTPLRGGWAASVPVLHLDATMQDALVRPYLPYLRLHEPVTAATPHVHVRQVLGSPTTAKALTPDAGARERDHRAAPGHLRGLQAYIALRARECGRDGDGLDVLVVGQKAAVDLLRDAGLPPRTEAVHFNALSGLDRWGEVACIVILGRTLPAPATVGTLAAALTGRVPLEAGGDVGWWYGTTERRIRLARGTHAIDGELHADPTAEAIRWSICEGELIQAVGRGRGVNRTTETPLAIDILTDVVLPVTVSELIPWDELSPTRRDLMAVRGVVLENAADMAACFPDLWESRDVAKKDNQRRGTNCYYRIFYNSKMSPSSALATYRPEGPGHKLRTARFDLSIIRDPETWLTRRLGPLASFSLEFPERPAASDAARLADLTRRLHAAMARDLAARKAALDALAARLAAAAPAGAAQPDLVSPPIKEANQ